MSRRRWTDPRDHRTWELTACTIRIVGSDGSGTATPAPARRTLCFDSAATPRCGHAISCSPGLEMELGQLDDQGLALCLDGAREGGFLWMDERNGEVWWIRRSGARLRARSTARDLEISPAPAADPAQIPDERLRAIVDGVPSRRRRPTRVRLAGSFGADARVAAPA